MRKFTKTLTYIFISAAFIINSGSTAFADEKPTVEAISAILIDETTSKVLYEKEPDKKMFPASTTKLLTALVALEYLSPEELVVAGDEVNSIPSDSSRAYHVSGETLKVENLIRGLIIPSGNETACIVAMEVARRISEDENVAYASAEKLFCRLMNERAKSLGAINTNFVNPHGYHNDNHYTTARDMSLIAHAAMQNPLIKQIVQEKEFIGNGAGENPDPSALTKEYKWETHNELLLPGEFNYGFATGMKTGFTNEAGYTLVASATKEDKDYIAVIFLSSEKGRLTDAINLFDYGFETFNTEIIQQSGKTFDDIAVANPRLGDKGYISTVSNDSFSYFMSKEELARVESDVTYTEDLIAPILPDEEPYEGIKLITPIAANQIVGKVEYSLDGKVIFTSNILSKDEALERTFNTDVDYYLERFKASVFSAKAIPFWIGGITLFILIVIFIVSLIRNRRNNRRRSYTTRKRYY